jgi:hypothetical protein
MNNKIVADGYDRLKRGQKEMTSEFIARKREAIEKKYKQLIAAAKPHEKEQIHERLAGELSRLYNHEPSASALWLR